MTKITIDRALMEQALEALTCSNDSGHTCSHCDDYVDRNSVVRQALRAALATVEQDRAREFVNFTMSASDEEEANAGDDMMGASG